MKYILSVLFLFFFVSAFSQVYQEMPQYGYRANRFAFDSTLQIPTTCGVPTLKSVVSVNKKSAIAFDSCNNRFYYYNPVNATWILLTGGGTTITSDTAKVVIAQVRNAESTTLQIGEVVFLKGSTGNVASVRRATNLDDSTSSRTLGVVRAAIAANGTGFVTTQGQVEKMNLGAYAEGDILWLDSVAGAFTKTKPIAPKHGVFIGIVERANQGNGIAYIKPQNGYELGEIHDVQIINPTNNQMLVYSDTQKVWKNRNALDTTSLSNRINTKFAIADTGNKWVNSVAKVNDTTIRVIKNTTTTDFVITGRVIDTTSLSNRINTKFAIADTGNKWVNSVTKLNDSTIRVIKNTTTSDLLIRGNPQQATGSNGLSGTSTITLGGNLNNGTTAIESTTDGLSSMTIGSTRKLDAFAIRNNQTTINSGSDIFLIQPTAGTDTTTYKPLGVASNGKISRINNWFASTATTIDTANKFVNNVTKINDTAIRVWKGTTSSVISLAKDLVYTQSPIMSKVSNDSNIIYFNADTANVWRGGGGGIPTLQQVLDNNKDLANGNNFQGTDAGTSNTGTNVIAIGASAGSGNTGNLNVFLGSAAGLNNTGTEVISIGNTNASGNSANGVIAIGSGSVQANQGTNVIGIGSNNLTTNTGVNVVAIGLNCGYENTGSNVNFFGSAAGNSNTFSNVNLFGYNATATADEQIVFGATNGAYNTRFQQNNTQDNLINIPDSVGTLVLSVNGAYPDLKGNINTFKTYSASISANGASAPTLNNQFINQLGTISFSVTASEYVIQCTGCFPPNKTYIAKPNFPSNFAISANAYRFDNDEIYIELFNSSGSKIMNTFDDMMIEIKVYN